MQVNNQSPVRFITRLLAVFLFSIATALTALAQSTNIDFPTPVVSNEVSGVIEARDVGDARLTRHYYLLGGTQGDLIVTVESNNLNGDVDLFTAGSLRPLTKLNIFSGLSTTSTSKSVYLRRHETLILRVQARSASDESGNYRVRFSGGFEAVANAEPSPDSADPTVSESRSSNRKVRRVNSAGARINEPLPEIAANTDPIGTVPPATVEPEKPQPEPEAPTPVETAPVKPKPSKPINVARTKPSTRGTRKKPTTTSKKKTEEPVATVVPEPVPEPAPPPAPAEPVLNPRLIIETRDGVRVERYMSEVRRVTVERGLLVVVTKDGKVERRPMSTILRVAIEP